MLTENDSHNCLSILIADDNMCDQELMLRLLNHIGLSADVVGSGMGVINALQSQHYNVILMDVQMPVMDGLETTRYIRHRWHDRIIRIIAVTGCIQKGDREMCIQAGMDDYIAKPAVKGALENALSRCNLY
jgi:CheY-like chemotaxis protein